MNSSDKSGGNTLRKQVVAGLIVNQRGKVLICQRTRSQALPLKWEFPGGKIEPGEQPEEALLRELAEELGIRAIIGPEVAQVEHVYKNRNAVELRFYLVQSFAGEIKNLIFEDVRWVSTNDLPQYDFLDADTGLVRDLASGKIRLPKPESDAAISRSA